MKPDSPSSEETVTLYRPTGPKELELFKQSGFKRWPPRLREQPIFYPVTNERYATEITTKWNVRDKGVGYVTRFKVKKSFMDKYQIQQVGPAAYSKSHSALQQAQIAFSVPASVNFCEALAIALESI